jgi:hypothetical protein
MNPYPCGYHGDPVKECTCSLTQVLRYQKRISGPLLDRIDIHPRRSAWGSATSTCRGWSTKSSSTFCKHHAQIIGAGDFWPVPDIFFRLALFSSTCPASWGHGSGVLAKSLFF